MVRSQLRGGQIEDDSITGADIHYNIGLYDETHDYISGDKVIWKSSVYEVKYLPSKSTVTLL